MCYVNCMTAPFSCDIIFFCIYIMKSMDLIKSSFEESEGETPEISETDSQYWKMRTLLNRHRNTALG